MPARSEPTWTTRPPARFEIVACYYPESTDQPGQYVPKLRPALVTEVRYNARHGLYACRVAYGTKTLKIMQRQHLDVIIQNAMDLEEVGLAVATRFDLDCQAPLPWISKYFGCWTECQTPKIGSLTEAYIKQYAYLMMRRESI